jgi:HAD superfamily hydrolase (TIGR01662 family)
VALTVPVPERRPTLKAVVFDVGETLLNEERYWRSAAEQIGVEPHALWAALGLTIARGEHHRRVYDYLEVEAPHGLTYYDRDDFYPDALACLAELRGRGLYVGVAGNQSHELEEWIRGQGLEVDLVASSARWGVEKPSPGFFARIIAESGFEPAEIAYVGDRVDNDVEPARAAGLLAVHVRRGPWGRLQDPSAADLRVDSLAELPARLAAHG